MLYSGENLHREIHYNSRMLVDTAEITVRGGHGGAGMPKKLKGPNGGNGGHGGDV